MFDITNNKSEYKIKIETFLSQLDSEYFYIKIDIEKILNSKYLLIETSGNKVIGICCLSKWHGFYKSIFLFSKKCQGLGLGKKTSIQLNNIAKNKFNLIMGVVDKDNIGMLKVCLDTGYKIFGKRNNIIYLIAPMNIIGYIVYFFLKCCFPFISFVYSIVKFK